MPKYVIEREIAGLGDMSGADLAAASKKSNEVLCQLGPQIVWQQSYVTDEKMYCVYIAPDKDIIEEHARCGGFPADRISEVTAVIDPSSGE